MKTIYSLNKGELKELVAAKIKAEAQVPIIYPKGA